ncbi:MAG: DUF1566 domain-containing protein [Limnobacter sp.]|uniref:DUF1566 domain-containing protein n=1 Tax=Limnobacter sp. TaxID=2003368 RepID=UPI00391896F3
MSAIPKIQVVIDGHSFEVPLQSKVMPLTAPSIPTTPRPVQIGEYWAEQGGVLAGLMRGENSKPDYFLIVPIDPAAEVESIEWGGKGKNEENACSEFDGKANTLALAVDSEVEHPAAQWAHELAIGKFNDFYLPARRELSLMYANVPELLKKEWYWSSTQYSEAYAWLQTFYSGVQSSSWKNGNDRARAVRRLLVI